VVQCVAVCCSALQLLGIREITVCGNVVKCVAVQCSVLQCVAVWCHVLQCVAVTGD